VTTPADRSAEHVRACEACQEPGTMCIDHLVLLDESFPEDFLATCRTEHDGDPGAWHRGMLSPPLPVSDRCAFCGVPWSEIQDRSDPSWIPEDR